MSWKYKVHGSRKWRYSCKVQAHQTQCSSWVNVLRYFPATGVKWDKETEQKRTKWRRWLWKKTVQKFPGLDWRDNEAQRETHKLDKQEVRGKFCVRDDITLLIRHKQEREGAPLPSLHHLEQAGCSIRTDGRTLAIVPLHCHPVSGQHTLPQSVSTLRATTRANKQSAAVSEEALVFAVKSEESDPPPSNTAAPNTHSRTVTLYLKASRHTSGIPHVEKTHLCPWWGWWTSGGFTSINCSNRNPPPSPHSNPQNLVELLAPVECRHHRFSLILQRLSEAGSSPDVLTSEPTLQINKKIAHVHGDSLTGHIGCHQNRAWVFYGCFHLSRCLLTNRLSAEWCPATGERGPSWLTLGFSVLFSVKRSESQLWTLKISFLST